MEGDLESLYEKVFSDGEVMRYVFGGTPLSKQRSAELFSSAFDHDATGLKLGVLVEKDTDEVIGFSGLMECKVLGDNDYEIGFVLAKAAWKKGYAAEIGQGQLQYGFEKVGCNRLLAQVAPANVHSIRALERIGMKHHSTLESEGRGTRHVYVASSRYND